MPLTLSTNPRAALLFGLAASLASWWVSSLPLLLSLDWDAAFHHWLVEHMLLTQADSCGYGSIAWTCGYTGHLSLVPLYALVAAVLGPFGGEVLTAMRIAHAVGVGVAAACLALLLLKQGASLWVVTIVALSWFLGADVVFLLRTIEDDCLLLGWSATLIVLCERMLSRANWRTAFASGLTLSAGVLTNYPTLAWAPVLLAVVIVSPQPNGVAVIRLPVRRLLAIALGFAAGIAAWGMWVSLIDPQNRSWQRYMDILFPPSNVVNNSTGLEGFLRYVALHQLDTLLPPGWFPSSWIDASPGRWQLVAAVLLSMAAFGMLWPVRRGLSATSSAGRLASLSCLALVACTIPAAWYGDHASEVSQRAEYRRRPSPAPAYSLPAAAVLSVDALPTAP